LSDGGIFLAMAGELPDVYLKFEAEDSDVDLEGDCADHDHPGEEGWTEIKSFSFGFGFQTSASKAAPAKLNPRGMNEKAQIKALTEQLNTMQREKSDDSSHEWGQCGALNFEKCRISKSANRLSADLVHLCHKGEPIDKVTLEACRPSGEDESIKAPFLKIIFTNVYIRDCNLRLATEGLPTEEFELEYETVQVETWWTDNATGKRLPERPFRVNWDLKANQGKFESAG
jgi:type VI protein secretion system component Hcp